MSKQQPQTQEETKPMGMTKKEALDTILEKCAKSKKQIARGQYVTYDEMRVLSEIQLKHLAASGAKD